MLVEDEPFACCRILLTVGMIPTMSFKDEIDISGLTTASRIARERIDEASGLDSSPLTAASRVARDRMDAVSGLDSSTLTDTARIAGERVRSSNLDSKVGTALGSALDRIKPDFVFDQSSIRTQLDSAIGIGSRDPLSAVIGAVKTGSSIASLIDSQATAGINLHDTISALGELRRPYDQFANISNFAPYVGSITNLASVSGIASSIEHLSGLDSTKVPSSISVGKVASIVGMESPELLANPVIAGNFGLDLRSSVISSLPVTTITGVLAGTTLASTGTLLGVERAYEELRVTHHLSSFTATATEVPSYLRTLHEGLSSLTSAAKLSWDNISMNPGILEGMSLFSARSPAIEIYSASQAAAVISLPEGKFPPIDARIEEIIDDTVDEFEGRLSLLEPALVEMYRGGIAAIESGGPDWRRQTMVSFRELTTHVMHMLAPDSDVTPWAKPHHFDRGKLTRKARLEYIFASVAGGEFTGFFKADLKASIELFDLLNNGTHRLSSKASSKQLRYLRGRLVNLITSMLEARGH